MKQKYDSLRLEELNKLYLEYKEFNDFIKRHQNMDFVSFDFYTVNDLNLFTLQPDFDFKQAENTADKIIKVLPHIKKIFAKPLLHLKESDQILPVESVKLINNATIEHISNHSELWDDIKDNSIKPLKLLTRVYEDNYGIYENLVFCDTVDLILSIVRKSIRFLKDLVYANQSIELNLLERLNHLYYFLAIGKLHTGYIRNYDQYYSSAKLCLEKLDYIYNSILPQLKRPIYRKNKLRPNNLKLRKTNILAMHKDYHPIYSLRKYLETQNVKASNLKEVDVDKLLDNYIVYCNILSVFSISHFNFITKDIIHLDDINLNFVFKKWKLNICSSILKDKKVIEIKIKKDRTYRIILIPSLDKKNSHSFNKRRKGGLVNEYIYLTPYEFENIKNKDCCVSISNVDSFRRLQQIILRGMIYSDKLRNDCPFCSNGLKEVSDNRAGVTYECESCRTQIIDTVCTEDKTPFTYTKIANFENKKIRKDNYKNEKWLYYRLVEGKMYYRNITKINQNMDIICPYCNKVH